MHREEIHCIGDKSITVVSFELPSKCWKDIKESKEWRKIAKTIRNEQDESLNPMCTNKMYRAYDRVLPKCPKNHYFLYSVMSLTLSIIAIFITIMRMLIK